jgi:phospholipid/cholesterol/gamma-HCH transport system substrate-binding protein
MTRKHLLAATAVVLIGLMIAGVALVVRDAYFGPKRISAYFTSATGIYPGDGVRISGVKVGTITAIQPAGGQVKMTLDVDRDVPIPADAKAVIVAQSLIAARYVQLAPAYETSGPTMPDGAVIPVDRTAIPVEWDEVKIQLTRLATDLGPRTGVSGTSVSRFIDSAANALQGNGDKLRQTLAQLSGVGRILADGSGNLVDILENLQTFVTALRDSGEQIVQFGDRFATLTSVLNDSRSTLDDALTDLSTAVGDVQRFIAGSRDQTAEQVQRLANVTQTLVDHKVDLENVLHATPNAIANGYNIYDPDTGTPLGAFVINNLSDPVAFICGAIGAVADVTSAETAKLCAQYLGPALRPRSLNYIPVPVDPFLMKSPSPSNLIYSDPNLAPGGAGPTPGPPEIPPSVSAYTGLDNDVPPPAGYGPAGPVEPPASTTLPDLLLPAEATPIPVSPPPASPPPPTSPPPADGMPPS